MCSCSFIIKRLHQLKMRTQILILGLFITVVTLSFITIVVMIQNKVILQIFTESSEKILRIQDGNFLHTHNKQLRDYLQLKTNIKIHTLQTVEQLYQLLYNYKNNQILIPCQNQTNFNYYLPQFCYASYNSNIKQLYPDTTIAQKLQKLTTLINEHIYIIDTNQTQRFYYSSTEDNQLGIIYPQVLLNISFRHHKMDWYETHYNNYLLNNNLTISQSNIFLSSTKQIYQESITISIVNQITNELIAIAGTDIDVEDEQMNKIQTNIFLINSKAQIVFRNVLDLNLTSRKLYYLYDQSSIGFNYSDYQEIINFAKGVNYTSNCFESSQTILCRINSIYKQSLLIVSEQLMGNFTLIMFTNTTFQKELKHKFSQLEDNINIKMQNIYLIQFYCSLVLLFICICFIIMIFRPIQNIMSTAQLSIKSFGSNLNKEVIKMLNKYNNKQNNQLYELQLQLQNFGNLIENNQFRKCLQCKQLDKITYLKKRQIEKQIYTQLVIKQLQNGSILNFQMKIFKIITDNIKKMNKSPNQFTQQI